MTTDSTISALFDVGHCCRFFFVVLSVDVVEFCLVICTCIPKSVISAELVNDDHVLTLRTALRRAMPRGFRSRSARICVRLRVAGLRRCAPFIGNLLPGREGWLLAQSGELFACLRTSFSFIFSPYFRFSGFFVFPLPTPKRICTDAASTQRAGIRLFGCGKGPF